LCDRVSVSSDRHNVLNNYFQNISIIGFGGNQNLFWKGMWVVFKMEKVDGKEIFSLAQLKGWL